MKDISQAEDLRSLGLKRVLAVFPHPDDETAFAAGFLQKSIAAGIDVKLICLSAGEMSTNRFGLEKNDDLAKVRRTELAEACRILGVKSYSHLNFPDGKFEEVYQKVKKNLLAEIEGFRPKFILTLEPCGIYGHPDHISLTRVLTELSDEKREDEKFDLIYATVDSHFDFRKGAEKMAKNPQAISPIQPNLRLKLDPKERAVKIKAFEAHRSQFKVDEKFIEQWEKGKLLSFEFFHWRKGL